MTGYESSVSHILPFLYVETMTSSVSSRLFTFGVVVLFAGLLLYLAACSSNTGQTVACTDDGRILDVGFYAFFAPVSYSANDDPDSEGFNTHLGYEADLLYALEAMNGAGLSFSRKPIALWDGIWLEAAGPKYDIVGGGITILDSRTRDAAGEEVVAFTSGHIVFRQSLLVRVEDAERLASHDKLTSDVRVGAQANTTGEARLLVLTGLANADGVLASGTRIETPQGEVVADGSPDYAITAASVSPSFEGRRHIHPPSGTLPQVVYLRDGYGEAELLAALADGSVDAWARGEIHNRDATHEFGAAFVVAALDSEFEQGGFALAMDDEELRSCLDEKIEYLTDSRRIGYPEWREDSTVFMRRAEMWSDGR